MALKLSRMRPASVCQVTKSSLMWAKWFIPVNNICQILKMNIFTWQFSIHRDNTSLLCDQQKHVNGKVCTAFEIQ